MRDVLSRSTDKAEFRDLACRLIASMNEGNGRTGLTHIQKSAFFLQELLGEDLDLGYVMYTYGPYCFEFTDAITWCDVYGEVTIEHERKYGRKFQTTDYGKERIKPNAALDKKVAWVTENISTRNVAYLERVATALYMKKRNSGLPDHEVAELIRKQKPHISMPVADAAIREVERLRQDAISHDLIPA